MALIFVRHGETANNEDGNEKLRGWLPIPLTLHGMDCAEETGKFLAKLGKKFSVIYTSDLVRAVQTATEVGEQLVMEIIPLQELRDWNTGSLAGSKITKDIITTLQKHIKDDSPVEGGGEKYFSDFVKRIRPVIEDCVHSNQLEIIVSHGRVATLIKAISEGKGGKPDMETLMNKPPIDPSGIMIISKDWKIHYMTPKVEGTGRQS